MARSASRREVPIANSAVSRRSVLRGGATVAAAGTFSAFLAACSSSSSSSPSASAASATSSAASLGSITYLLGWIANASYTGTYIADSKGYYKQHGLGVTIRPGGPSVSGMPLLISNKVQVADSDCETVGSAILQGGDVKIIGAGYQINPACIMSLASNPITTPQDLKGKTIGVGASDDAEWAAFLKANNIDKSELTTAPAGFDLSPLAAGQWDGYLGFLNDQVPEFTAMGIKTAVMRFADYGMPSFNDVYAVTGSSLNDAATRKQLAAFMAGEIQGWNEALTDPLLGAQLTVDVYGKSNGLSLKGELLAAKATNTITVSADTKAHGLLYMSQEGIEESIKTLSLTGLKASASMFDTSILEEAYPLVKSS